MGLNCSTIPLSQGEGYKSNGMSARGMVIGV